MQVSDQITFQNQRLNGPKLTVQMKQKIATDMQWCNIEVVWKQLIEILMPICI